MESLVFLGIALIIGIVWAILRINYEIYNIVLNKDLKLIKYKVKKNKVDCCFLDVDSKEKYIIHIRRFLLRKRFMTEEFAIESKPRTFYYNYITSILESKKEYKVTFYKSTMEKNFLLCLEESSM